MFHRDATLAHSAALAVVPHHWTSCGPLRPWQCHVANDSSVVSDSPVMAGCIGNWAMFDKSE